MFSFSFIEIGLIQDIINIGIFLAVDSSIKDSSHRLHRTKILFLDRGNCHHWS